MGCHLLPAQFHQGTNHSKRSDRKVSSIIFTLRARRRPPLHAHGGVKRRSPASTAGPQQTEPWDTEPWATSVDSIWGGIGLDGSEIGPGLAAERVHEKERTDRRSTGAGCTGVRLDSHWMPLGMFRCCKHLERLGTPAWPSHSGLYTVI